jgi:DNA mismatch repair protein MutS2
MVYPVSFENKIGFDRIRQMVAEQCLCELGRKRVEKITFLNSLSVLRHELIITEEIRKVILFEENFPQENFIDATTGLLKIKAVGTYPEVSDLNDLKLSLDTIKAIARFFSNELIKEKYPVICREASQVKLFPFVAEYIDQIINKHGQIKDNASADLKEIRELIKQKQVAVNRKLLSILKTAQQDGFAEADAEITIRDGRPVIPVSAGNKRKIGGLIHDESATGKTVYIEPGAIVELNNEIRELEYAERREIIDILTKFADTIRPYIPELIEAYNFLGKIDFLRAKAKFAIKINGILPIVHEEMRMEWRRAIHPLLYLTHKIENKEVVPLNLALSEQNRILLISGPNAGGKSVCLKTTGLLQYMLQCGLLVPMGENSEICLFDHIFIDIGDEQSLENDLSTYSSHLLNMKYFVKHANTRSLILIDEFGTGTEPALGGAIAEAILEELNIQKTFGIITTHYSNLKHMAAETPGIINGAMLFDTQKIQPLFQLAIGRPGSSFAIDIARKIGLPETIVKRASEKVGEDTINFEKHLREIIRDKKYWEDKRGKIRKVEKTLDDLYAIYSNELEDIQKERKKIISQAKSEAQNLLKEANKKIEGTIREIKEQNADKEKTRQLREEFEKFKVNLDDENIEPDEYERKITELQKAGKNLVKHSPEIKEAKVTSKKERVVEEHSFEIGNYVRMKGLDSIGEIIDVNEKSILIAFGSMITTVEREKLEHISSGQKKSSDKKSVNIVQNISERKLNFKSDIDIRGKRADEAMAIVSELIEDAVLVSVRHLRILHGKGNGILRQLIRDYLKTVDVVKSVRDEHADRGGAGITLVELDL